MSDPSDPSAPQHPSEPQHAQYSQYPPPGAYPSPSGAYQQPGYQQPGYQQPGYQQQPGYPAPARRSLAERVGERTLRRPQPRQGVSLAGVGVGLAVVGVLVWGGDFLAGGGGAEAVGGGSSRQLLGIALSLAVVVIGYTLAVRRSRGPLATAGVVASALGVPVLFGFLTVDSNGGGTSGLPVSLDAIVLVSVLVWVLSYLFVPGARGHAFYLGLSSVLLWVYVLDKAVPELFSPASLFFGFDPFQSDRPPGPDWATVAALSIMFGVLYYLVGFTLDWRGRAGAAVPFTISGFVAMAVGIAAASADLHEIGTGIVLIVLGLGLGTYGARSGRRFTTWAWSAAVAVGVAVIVGKVAGNNAAGGGIALIVCGVGLVFVGEVLARSLHEPDDLALPAMGANPVH
jgi:hypothetical protein